MSEKKVFNAVTPRPKYRGKEGEVWWHRVGQAVMNEKGNVTIYLDSVPLPSAQHEGKVVIMLFEKTEEDASERQQAQRTQSAGRVAKGGKKNDMDGDEIPF